MRKLIAGTLALVSLATVACGGSDSTGPASIAGSYTLQTVNGAALPVTLIEAGGYKLEVLSGTYTLAENKTFTAVATFRENDSGTITEGPETNIGTYTRSGSSVTFHDSETGDQITGTVVGNKLTLSGGGLVIVYVK